MAQKRTSSPDRSEDRQPQDIEPLIPLRSAQQEYELTQTLLLYPTLAERLNYLLDNESYYYVLGDTCIVDPDVIESAPKGLKRKLARVPVVAEWVRTRTGHRLTKQAVYQFRDGIRLQPRTTVTNAFADFWRIDYRLFDPSVPASRFEDPHLGASELDPLERRTFQLMNKIGFLGVRPREVKQSLHGQSDDAKRAFVQILQGLDRDKNSQDGTEAD